MKHKTIFVSIAAINETDLTQTIKSCLDNAYLSERIHFGIFSHYNDNLQPNLNFKNLKYIKCKYPAMLGVGPSRLNTLYLYDNEDYYLQIDSHMLFEKDWDEKIINQYNNIRQKHGKSIITTYVPWWSKNEDNSINFYSNINKNNNYSYPMEYDLENIYEGYPKQKTFFIDWNMYEYFEHYGFSAHFVFSEAQFFKDIIPDPLIMFGGEEPTMALRAWTNGYRIFTIKDPIVWHKNKGHGVLYEKDRLLYIGEQNFIEHYNNKSKNAIERSKNILTGNILGYWGAPTKDLLHKYEKFAKINFIDFYKKMEKYV